MAVSVSVSQISHTPRVEYSGHWTSDSIAAGSFGWGFENPADSGKTYLIDQIWIGSAEPAVLSLKRLTGYTATQNATQCDDLRQSGVASTATLLSEIVLGSTHWVLNLPFYAGEKIRLDYNGALKLTPGQALALYKESGPTGVVYFVVMWREE